MMKKDRVIKFGIAVVLVSAMVVGGSIAYFRAETASKNTMSSTNLKIALLEKGKPEAKKVKDNEVLVENVVPGTTIQKELFVRNIKESPSYIRVTLTKYWADSSGNKLPELEAKYIELITHDKSQWIVQDDDENNEVVYMYYKFPLKTNEETKDFLDQLKISSDGSQLDNSYANLRAKVDVEVDAIQEYAAQQAILSEWGLEVTINNQGIIQQVEE
ncbi:hypothetical protein [Longibaculum muris]|uniref:hypothetical protein n=1 Tax=Longibaculum muris TaxID=1796628 RepID=UPI0012B8771E|nr:hypothetical protein [Longibaculum muris]